jgi:tetratricopeptide (TPR) repeat protein
MLLNNLATYLVALGRGDEAVEAAARAQRIKEAKLPPENTTVVIGLETLGEALRAAGDLEESERILRRGLSLSGHTAPPYPADLRAGLLFELATTLYARRQIDEALDVVGQAIALRISGEGYHPQALARMLDLKASVLDARGEWSAAAAVRKEAGAIRRGGEADID